MLSSDRSLYASLRYASLLRSTIPPPLSADFTMMESSDINESRAFISDGVRLLYFDGELHSFVRSA